MGFKSFLNKISEIIPFLVLISSKDLIRASSIHPDSSNVADFSVQNMAKLNSHYVKMFSNLKGKDYGFATFGEACDPITPPELEDFLDLGRLILKDQEEEDSSPHPKVIQEHLIPKLKYFFDRSKLHCDFRRFLLCSKGDKTCGCPHSSMGLGKNGTCGFNLGKRCDFTEEKLNSLGILLLPKESGKLSCVGDAECVESFGAAAKICRCPIGYLGSNCKTSIYGESPIQVLTGGGGHHETISGRAFAKGKNNAKLMNSNHTDTEYFLFPEDIKLSLRKMMDFRGMFEPEERAKEAEILYNKMEPDDDKEDMVTMDIFIRRLANLTFGESCDPSKQKIIDNPPLVFESSNWMDPPGKDIKAWQTSLLKDKKPFCSYLEYFRCDENSKVCKCKEGFSFEKPAGSDKSADGGFQCLANDGISCDQDYENTFEFDPLKDRKRFSPPYSPECIPGTDCQPRPLFFVKQCWSGGGASKGSGSGNEIIEIETSAAETIAEVNARFTLNLGDSCNPSAHSVLLNPKDLDRSNFDQRILSLKQLLAKKDLAFCILDKFLNCSESSRKCECFENMVEEEGECRIKNFDSCGEVYVFGKEFYSEGSMMWKVEEVFKKSFKPLCVKNGVCGSFGSGSGGLIVPGKCSCKNNKAGPICADSRSLFASVLNPLKIQGFNKDNEINDVFYKMNSDSVRMEEQMVLKYGDDCDPVVGLMLIRIAGFYREVASRDEMISGKKTLHQYSKASKWIQYLLNEFEFKTGSKNKSLCNAFDGLQCHATSSKCRCSEKASYDPEDKICKIKVGMECDEKPLMAPWILSCQKNSECTPADYNFKFDCTCIDGFDEANGCSEDKSLIAGDNSTQETSTGDDSNGQTDPNNDDDPTQETDPKKSKDVILIAPRNNEIDYFPQINEMIGEILRDRRLPLDNKCETENEQHLFMYFPHLPFFDRNHYNHLPYGPRNTYYELKHVYKFGYHFCDRTKYLMCLGGKCECSGSHGLVRQGKSCRLSDITFCRETNTIFDLIYPLPQCKDGTKCTQLDVGVFKCIKIHNPDLE